jgi:hypothetical protein
MSERKKPTHVLFVKKKGGHSFQVGVGWSNDWGGVSIRLNPFVTLTDHDDFYINLYPDNRKPKEPVQYGSAQYEPPPLDDADIPF